MWAQTIYREQEVKREMGAVCETARAKADSHIVIGLLPRYKDGRQLCADKILNINRRLKAMSHDKGFNLFYVYWTFNEKPHMLKDGLYLNGEGAGILGTSTSIATHVHFWTQRCQPSSSVNGEG